MRWATEDDGMEPDERANGCATRTAKEEGQTTAKVT